MSTDTDYEKAQFELAYVGDLKEQLLSKLPEDVRRDYDAWEQRGQRIKSNITTAFSFDPGFSQLAAAEVTRDFERYVQEGIVWRRELLRLADLFPQPVAIRVVVPGESR